MTIVLYISVSHPLNDSPDSMSTQKSLSLHQETNKLCFCHVSLFMWHNRLEDEHQHFKFVIVQLDLFAHILLTSDEMMQALQWETEFTMSLVWLSISGFANILFNFTEWQLLYVQLYIP